MDRVRVLIADDQPIFRRGVAQSLIETEDVEDVIEMCPVTLLNRVEALSTLGADILIYGNMSRGLTSLIVPWVVLKQQPNMKVIVVGSAVDDDDLLNALTLGIAAYVPRHSSLDELLATVQTVAKGNNPIFQEVLTRPELALHVVDLYRTMVSSEETEEAPRVASVHLSCREVEVLEFAADGYSNKQIGVMMTLSERTVRNHMSSLLAKLGAHNRVEAVIKAIKKGIIMGDLLKERAMEVPEIPELPSFGQLSGRSRTLPNKGNPSVNHWPIMDGNNNIHRSA